MVKRPRHFVIWTGLAIDWPEVYIIDVNVRAGLWLPLFAYVETTMGSSEPPKLPSGATTTDAPLLGIKKK
jgi:hypothetical protein